MIYDAITVTPTSVAARRTIALQRERRVRREWFGERLVVAPTRRATWSRVVSTSPGEVTT
ncbi:hypothetical protein QZM13_08760 [Burkholderia cenocepacia]|nr:hypothetical protein [Burkholderia cenocepacia]MCW5142564.1 hypothetical protein [Burkholderia cenocepacia]MDN7691492.1 hypothetical protein [Burkholderia cenocepacia]